MKNINDNTNNSSNFDIKRMKEIEEAIESKKENSLKTTVFSLIITYAIITILNMATRMNFNDFLSIFIGCTAGVLFSAKRSYRKNTRKERAILKQYKKEQKEKFKKKTKKLTKSISKNKDIKEIENMIDKEFEIKAANIRNRSDDIETLKEVKNMLRKDFQNNDIVKQHIKRK